MSHEISMVSGEAEAFYAGNRPAWHGLGTVVGSETVTSAEALRLARLDWSVEQRSIFLPDGQKISDRVANVRTTPEGRDLYLGTVGRRYQIIQNHEAFSFLDSLVQEGEAFYESAGALRDGKRVWVLMKFPENLKVAGDDEIVPYILFSNGHDGTMACRCLQTPVRVVCQNTLSFALGRGKGEGITIRHSGKIEDKIEEARRVLGLVRDEYKKAEVVWNQLAFEKATEEQARAYFQSLYPMPARATDRQANRINRIQDALEDNYERGRGAEWVKGSWWGAYNAVTEFVDHTAFERRNTGSEQRFERIIYGAGAQEKAKALDLAVEMAGIAA